jgi:aminopeptidase-like protein
MGKRNLYPNLSTKNKNIFTRNLMSFLQYADGKNDLKKISKIIKVEYKKTLKIYNILQKNRLVS